MLDVRELMKKLSPFREQRGTGYLRVVLFWNPLLCVFFIVSFGSWRDFGRHWLGSMIVSTTVTSFCYGAVWTVAWAEAAFYRARGLVPPRHQYRFYLILSLFGMPPGLFLGFRFLGAWNTLNGRAAEIPRIEDYASGLMWGLGIVGIFFLGELRRRAIEAQRAAESRAHQAQISALTAQMNPHLLFNALNTVASMIPGDPGGAEEMTVRLADLYRGILASSRAPEHPLESELSICRDYLAIEKARFGDRLRVTVEAPVGPVLRVPVPALILQPIVENAIKYAIAPRASGGTVLVRAIERGGCVELLVEDDGPGLGRSPARSGNGTALANCRERLRLRYGEGGRIETAEREGGGARITVRIPAAIGGEGGP